MRVELFDSHTHLDAKEFDADRESVIKRAQEHGVSRILTVGAGNGTQSAKNAIALAEKYSFIWASVGVHPHDSGSVGFTDKTIDHLASHEKVVAIGETGLDYFRDWAPKEAQEHWFRQQIRLAHAVQKPLIIHSRDAGEDCLNILLEENASTVGGVFHCFAEDARFAARLLEMNFYVSFPGTLTFKNANTVRDAARAIPVEQILIETDAPYMAPVPYRGKRCETAFIVETAKMLAEVKDCSLEEIAKHTSENACKLFNISE